ncbi:MAG: Com family DNA-binding transcriptional regulator [Ignavibacteria bacterium]|nr:Com family DNA-binding transcriptional regulator [Ignavibacteria bacterium]
MIVKCKNCLPKEGIDIPDFSISEKSKLMALKVQSPLNSIKYIIDNLKINHRDAKYIVTHINEIYGQCNRCKFDSLDEEHINCPKCGALNFNWKIDNGTEI